MRQKTQLLPLKPLFPLLPLLILSACLLIAAAAIGYVVLIDNSPGTGATAAAGTDSGTGATAASVADAGVVAAAAAVIADAGITAGERNIYIGDIIPLKITTDAYSADELERAFHDFEIVDMESAPGGYLLSLRSFAPGEHRVYLGDKEIVINVSSTLDDIKTEELFEGGEWVIKPGFSLNMRIPFVAAAAVFFLSGAFTLIKLLFSRKAKQLTPLQLFMKRCEQFFAKGLDHNNNYLVDLTFYFKEYLEAVYEIRIIGKTSGEIISELEGIQALGAMLPEIAAWLNECDRIKFSGGAAHNGDNMGLVSQLRDVVEKIDMNNGHTGRAEHTGRTGHTGHKGRAGHTGHKGRKGAAA